MGYQEIKEEGKRCDWDLRGEERKETFGTYSDSSFKVVLVHPDSSASHSSLKRKNPRILLIIYTSSFTKVCSLLKLNLGLVSRNSAEFLNICLVRLKLELWVWSMFLTVFSLVIQLEFNTRAEIT